MSTGFLSHDKRIELENVRYFARLYGRVEHWDVCPDCCGFGSGDGCERCDGTGELHVRCPECGKWETRPCCDCHGTGERAANLDCKACGGHGYRLLPSPRTPTPEGAERLALYPPLRLVGRKP